MINDDLRSGRLTWQDITDEEQTHGAYPTERELAAEQTHAIKTVIRPNDTTIKLYWADALNAYVTIPDETKTAAERAIEQGRQPDHE